jgi:tetrahydromethanopterin S-methyltransferase subunit F
MTTKQQYDSTKFDAPADLRDNAQIAASRDERLIRTAVLRLNGHILGFIFGLIAALLIFAATNWLVLKGGEVVGPHLGLLDQFFYGYSVTFGGSFIGAFYGFIFGYLSGLFIGWVYNAVIFLKSR